MRPAAPPQLRLIESYAVTLTTHWSDQVNWMIAPYWRMYWHPLPGVALYTAETSCQLGPDRVVFIPPYGAWRAEHEQGHQHWFAYFQLGRDYDTLADIPQPYEVLLTDTQQQAAQQLCQDGLLAVPGTPARWLGISRRWWRAVY